MDLCGKEEPQTHSSLQEKFKTTLKERDRKGLLLLLDWEKAFDNIDYEMLFSTLEHLHIPEQLISLIKGLYKNPEFYVEIDGK